MKYQALATLLIHAASLTPTVATADTVFSDSIFNNADWTASKTRDTTPGQTATFSVGQVLFGGNPGTFRRVTHTYNTGTITVGHLRNGAVYNPATQGAILKIGYSFDLIHLNPPPGQAVGYAMLILQNGTYYEAVDLQENTIYDPQWKNFIGKFLSSTDFVRVSATGPDHPDFSTDGLPIQFGYESGNTSDGGTYFREAGIDNWAVYVINQVDNGTPVTASIAPAVEVSWPSELNRAYQVQWASALDTNTWLNLGPPVQGSGETMYAFDSTRNHEKKFYRVVTLDASTP